MKISILTLFPEMFAPLQASMAARAAGAGAMEFNIVNIRDYSDKKHKNTDDAPFGGGAGMVMLAQPIADCMAAVAGAGARRIYLSPRGKTLTNVKAKELASCPELVLLCGHYEGVDQRALDMCIDEEISIGDYILTGGELAAMVLSDCVMRFVPGVLGHEESAFCESFEGGLLEHPHYTRPADFRGLSVPPVLLSGNHADIEKWRRRQQLLATHKTRPELLGKAPLTPADLAFLREHNIYPPFSEAEEK